MNSSAILIHINNLTNPNLPTSAFCDGYSDSSILVLLYNTLKLYSILADLGKCLNLMSDIYNNYIIMILLIHNILNHQWPEKFSINLSFCLKYTARVFLLHSAVSFYEIIPTDNRKTVKNTSQ